MKNWCPNCREETGLYERGVCQWCDTPLRHKGGRKPGSGSKLSDDQLRALHRVHIEQNRSINDLARDIYQKAGYRTPHACAVSISGGFKRLNLRARDRVEMTVTKSLKHGRASRVKQRERGPDYVAYRREQRLRSGETHGRRCEGVKEWPPRKGQPCSRSALRDSQFCFNHDPRNRKQIERALEKARSLQGAARSPRSR